MRNGSVDLVILAGLDLKTTFGSSFTSFNTKLKIK